ncbi:MAG: zinc-binding dehydrogenase [Oscillospiraceae bacterium]|nr:zinc-binding dehydrogenase [Oscillospiraceae bacterium]
MINCIYQLTAPENINLKFENINFDNKILVRPRFMSICRADQRYYFGKRELSILKKKLPMALIHESCGVIIYDGTSKFKVGSKVVMIPNVPGARLNNAKIKKQNFIYENYESDAKFLSSGLDGFMREIVALDADRILPFESNNESIFCITELISVVIHAIKRFLNSSHLCREKIAVFGDGPVGFLLCLALKKMLPESKVLIFGRHQSKLSRFSFADETFSQFDKNIKFDHAFECVGGYGSANAIETIINCIKPQGTVIIMGVSEEKIPVNTRDILEKGLSFIGASRSGREDFKLAIDFLENEDFSKRASIVVSDKGTLSNIQDIRNIFAESLTVTFKLFFEWNI